MTDKLDSQRMWDEWAQDWKRLDHFWARIGEREKIILFSLWYSKNSRSLKPEVMPRNLSFEITLDRIIRYNGDGFPFPKDFQWKLMGILESFPTATFIEVMEELIKVL